MTLTHFVFIQIIIPLQDFHDNGVRPGQLLPAAQDCPRIIQGRRQDLQDARLRVLQGEGLAGQTCTGILYEGGQIQVGMNHEN